MTHLPHMHGSHRLGVPRTSSAVQGDCSVDDCVGPLRLLLVPLEEEADQVRVPVLRRSDESGVPVFVLQLEVSPGRDKQQRRLP